METLPLAFVTRKAHGHDIILEWRERDPFSVDDTRRGKLADITRIGAVGHIMASEERLIHGICTVRPWRRVL